MNQFLYTPLVAVLLYFFLMSGQTLFATHDPSSFIWWILLVANFVLLSLISRLLSLILLRPHAFRVN